MLCVISFEYFKFHFVFKTNRFQNYRILTVSFMNFPSDEVFLVR